MVEDLDNFLAVDHFLDISVQRRQGLLLADEEGLCTVPENDSLGTITQLMVKYLTGQCASESIGDRQYSGTGGALDFAMGAYRSKGGRGIIASPSTAKNATVSRIQPFLSPGAQVSITRNVTDYIVTEYGVAKLRGATIRERAQRLIAIAHPDFRRELEAQAKEFMLW